LKLLRPEETGEDVPKVNLGALICAVDSTPLEIRPMDEEIEKLTQEILNRFIREKERELEKEGEFIEKLNALRREVTAITTDTSSAPPLQGSQPIEAPTEGAGAQPTPWAQYPRLPDALDVPYAAEFWKFYYEEGNIYDPIQYLGHQKAMQKIKGLLDEINLHILNPDVLDITRPLVEKLENGKIYYVGDTHGSIYDTDRCIRFFVKEIEKGRAEGYPVLVIFDGDYVDRQDMDIHNVLYIFAFTLLYPNNVRLLRGNHEEVTIGMQYGFWNNINKYLPNSFLFNDFEYTFINLPLIHVVKSSKGTIMCLHGGVPFYADDPNKMPIIPDLMGGKVRLSPMFATVDEMDDLSRQILWSDPAVDLPPNTYYLPSKRGVGYNFGREIFEQWLYINKVDRIVRGHEVFLEGHREFFENRLISLFSSSNYVDRDIQARILEVDLSKPWEKNWRLLRIVDELAAN